MKVTFSESESECHFVRKGQDRTPSAVMGLDDTGRLQREEC